MPVHIKISRRVGHLHNPPIHFLRHHHLAPQPTRIRQAVRHIQHVLLVLVQRVHEVVVVFVLKYYVAGGAGANALTGALEIDVVALRGLEERLANEGADGEGWGGVGGGGVGVGEG